MTGGGTGGHTIPALATVDAIKGLAARSYPGLDVEFLYVGSSHGLEARLAPEAGLKFTSISTGKLRRSSNPVRMLSLANIRDAINVPLGFGQALKIVNAFRPNVVFSTGGYVSVPCVFAAALLRVPLLMHEQTVQIGLANRWSSRVATRIALTYPESVQGLDKSERNKAFVTGGIVRKVVLGGIAARGRAMFGFDGELSGIPIVYVTGGAQGSSIINRAVEESLPALLAKCCIIHQCGRQRGTGEQDEARLTKASMRLPDNLRNRYVVKTFIGDEIGDLYAAADLVVGRSGAGTVTELTAVGKAALFIPLVPTGGDEQTKNADRQASAGAAEVIKQSDFSATVLLEKVSAMLADPQHLKEMGILALKLAAPDAADLLAEEVIKLGLE